MPPLQLLGVSGAELALNEQIKRQVHNFFSRPLHSICSVCNLTGTIFIN